MQHSEILSLITSSDLTIQYAFEHTRRYGVSMCINGRFQNDVLEFPKEVFEDIVDEDEKSKINKQNKIIEDVQSMINASKDDMLRAAKTKSGLLSDSEEEKQAKKENRKTAVKREKKEDSDVEKYLKKMRAKGNKLAKTVKYG